MQNNKEIKCRICGKTDSLEEWMECNRKYIGFEIIPEYVNFANDRIQKLGLQDVDGLW